MSNTQGSMSDVQVEQLLNSPEDQSLEFKMKLTDQDLTAHSIAALANSGGGQIVIGVADGGKAVGVKDPTSARELVEKAAQTVEPQVPLNFEEGTASGEQIVVAKVEPEDADGPYLSPEGAFVRRDAEGETVPLSTNELADAYAQAKGGEALTPFERNLVDAVDMISKELTESRTEAQHARRLRAKLPELLIGTVLGAAVGIGVPAIPGL